MAGKFYVSELMSGTNKLEAEYARISIKGNSLALTFNDGTYHSEARLKTNGIYEVRAMEGEVLIADVPAKFESYHYMSINSPTGEDKMVIGDNTILFSIME